MSRGNYSKSENYFGRNFKRWRDEHQLTLNQVSKLLDTSSSYISEIERGVKFPSFDMLVKIRSELRIDLNNFITGDLTSVVMEKMLDYKVEQIDGMQNAIEKIDNLTDEIKKTIQGVKKRK